MTTPAPAWTEGMTADERLAAAAAGIDRQHALAVAQVSAAFADGRWATAPPHHRQRTARRLAILDGRRAAVAAAIADRAERTPDDD